MFIRALCASLALPLNEWKCVIVSHKVTKDTAKMLSAVSKLHVILNNNELYLWFM